MGRYMGRCMGRYMGRSPTCDSAMSGSNWPSLPVPSHRRAAEAVRTAEPFPKLLLVVYKDVRGGARGLLVPEASSSSTVTPSAPPRSARGGARVSFGRGRAPSEAADVLLPMPIRGSLAGMRAGSDAEARIPCCWRLGGKYTPDPERAISGEEETPAKISEADGAEARACPIDVMACAIGGAKARGPWRRMERTDSSDHVRIIWLRACFASFALRMSESELCRSNAHT